MSHERILFKTKRKYEGKPKMTTEFQQELIAILNKKYRKPNGEEQRKKLKERYLGNYWYNNGIINVSAKECPEGFVAGIIKRKHNAPC